MSINRNNAHGGEVYALARRLHTSADKLLDFSSNANIFAYGLTEQLVRQTPYPFVHYPDSDAEALTEALAQHELVDPERILIGNGGAELIWPALRALAPRKIFFIGPVFSEYILACKSMGIVYDILTPSAEHEFSCLDDTMQALWESDADLVVLVTPNNPAAVTYANIHSMLHMIRAPRLLIDNSYREFLYGTDDYPANHYRSYLESLRPGVSLFTLHSFTKFFCCPGIRLGYMLGERPHLQRIAALRPSWTVNPFAQEMGERFLGSIDRYRETLVPLHAAVAHMGRELRRLPLMNPDNVFEGPGFLCCGLTPRFNAERVCSSLLKHRIIVRNCDTIPGMPSGYIRVQARPDQDSARLLEALELVGMDGI